MKKVFRNIMMVLILLTLVGVSEVSAQCYKGQQNKVENSSIFKRIGDLLISIFIQSTQPVDPNEIIGLDGYDAIGGADTLRWVSATQTLAYTVYFENDADFATAAASKTMVTHSNVFNFNKAISPNTGPYILL